MLRLVHSMKGLPFGALMEVYAQSNRENSEEFWPDLSYGEGLLRAEQEFYQYLQQVFFPTRGAVYCLWEVAGRPVAALRLEPYRDGLLLEALETAPEQRQKGYAAALIRAVLDAYQDHKIYSHVGKGNLASLRTHLSCGFQRVSERAVYADGSVNDRCCTLLYKGKL